VCVAHLISFRQSGVSCSVKFHYNSPFVIYIYILFSPVSQQPLVGQDLLIIEASRSHSDTPHSVGLLWKSDRPAAGSLPDNALHLQQTGIHAPCGIRTRNPGKRVAAHPRLTLRCHWDRLYVLHFNVRRSEIPHVMSRPPLVSSATF